MPLNQLDTFLFPISLAHAYAIFGFEFGLAGTTHKKRYQAKANALFQDRLGCDRGREPGKKISIISRPAGIDFPMPKKDNLSRFKCLKYLA